MIAVLWSFAKSPIGIGIVAFLALMVYVQVQRHDATEAAEAQCNAGQYKAQAEQLELDLTAAQALAEQQKLRADALDSQNDLLIKARNDLLAQIAANPNAGRKFDGGTLSKLRGLK